MRLGLFMMPLHDPDAPLPPLIHEDRECIILLDRLGYDEAWVGEHYTARSEPIPDPLQFLASLIPVTKRIRLGTGVMNLPQHHPLQVASNAALFDILSEGRFDMGIGPGGLGSDMEVFGTLASDRNAMMIESIDMVHKLWAGEPPWDLQGKYWTIRLEKTVNPSLGHGRVVRPVQLPHPPVFTTAMSPKSGLAALAGERGWGLISANFMPHINARTHWETYCAGAERAGLRLDRAKWRLARSILVADTDAAAREHLARPDNTVRWYYDYFHRNLGGRGMLGIFKVRPDETDAAITVDRMLEEIVVSGSPGTVLDRLVQIVDEVGAFGGLLVAKKDWDDPAVHERSYRLLAEAVMPRLRQHVASRLHLSEAA